MNENDTKQLTKYLEYVEKAYECDINAIYDICGVERGLPHLDYTALGDDDNG